MTHAIRKRAPCSEKSKIITSDLIDFFSLNSDGEGPRSKFEQEDGQTDSEKVAHASACDIIGATSPSRERFEMFMISRNQFIGGMR